MKSEIILHKKNISDSIQVLLPISKSECNRALIISFVSEGKVSVKNISDSEDSSLLVEIMKAVSNGKTGEFNCGMAGTTYRFLTAALSIREGEFILTGNDRMKQRPIAELVKNLEKLGADISYLEKTGFPPLKIKGKELLGGKITMDPSISSQFITAIMMIAPELKNGLEISFESQPVSFPYIKMTGEIMKACGAKVEYSKKNIQITAKPYQPYEIECEKDWSAASYFYSLVAVHPNLKLIFPGLKSHSLQGDSIAAEIYSQFGIETIYRENGIEIFNNQDVFCDYFEYDFTDCPDLAQTLAFTCCALRIPGKLSGLSTLKNKETDRIKALKSEMEKCGMKVEVDSESIRFSAEKEIPKHLEIKTYDDHRMAMSACVLAMVAESVKIENKEVVGKSFPKFWEEIQKIFSLK